MASKFYRRQARGHIEVIGLPCREQRGDHPHTVGQKDSSPLDRVDLKETCRDSVLGE